MRVPMTIPSRVSQCWRPLAITENHQVLFMVVMELPISPQCCDVQGQGADAIAKPNEENPMGSMPMQVQESIALALKFLLMFVMHAAWMSPHRCYAQDADAKPELPAPAGTAQVGRIQEITVHANLCCKL